MKIKLYNPFKNFRIKDWIIWLFSITALLVTFFVTPKKDVLTLIASLIGVTALIFVSKGDFLGQIIMIFFCLLYAYISFFRRYYSETITYACMSLPMTIISLITWIKNPSNNDREVQMNYLNVRQLVILALSSIVVTIAFFFILTAFNTAQIWVSTLSIATSFIAVYLTAMRSPYHAFAYAINDIVLIVLWIIATVNNIENITMVLCFAVFLVNDINGFVSWLILRKKQTAQKQN